MGKFEREKGEEATVTEGHHCYLFHLATFPFTPNSCFQGLESLRLNPTVFPFFYLFRVGVFADAAFAL